MSTSFVVLLSTLTAIAFDLALRICRKGQKLRNSQFNFLNFLDCLLDTFSFSEVVIVIVVGDELLVFDHLIQTLFNSLILFNKMNKHSSNLILLKHCQLRTYLRIGTYLIKIQMFVNDTISNLLEILLEM